MKNLPYFFFGVGESYSFSFNYDNSDDRIDDYDTKINNKGDNIKKLYLKLADQSVDPYRP